MNSGLLRIVFFDLGNTLVTQQRTWVAGAQNVLDELPGKGVRLGLISNTGDLTRANLLKSLPVDFEMGKFEEPLINLSSEVGIEKPAPGIFRRAIERAGVTPNECLFCTEDFLHTLVAQQVGMRAARVTNPPDSDVKDLVKKLVAAGFLSAPGSLLQ